MPSEGRTWSYTDDSAHSSQSRAQHTTAAESSSSWTEAITDTRNCENDKPDFGIKAIKKPSLGFPAETDAQGQGISGQKPPAVPAFEYNANNDIDFYAIYGSLTPSAFLSCMSDELSDTVLSHDAVPLTENTNDFSAGMGDHFSALFSPAPDYQVEAKSPQSRLEDTRPCTLNKRTCMVSALKTLQALHMPPSVCLSAGATTSSTSSPQPRMTDCVLSTNREAVRLIFDMLECTCSSSSQVQLVLTIICGKLIAWCRAIVRNGFENSSTMRSAVDKHNVDHEDHTERVLHQPITVGKYSINVTLEYKIRGQVVFDELHHVEALTKDLSRRVKETKFGKHWNASIARSGDGPTSSLRSAKSDGPRPAEASHRSLTVFLYKQLQVAKEEITALIQSENGSTCGSGHTSDMDG